MSEPAAAAVIRFCVVAATSSRDGVRVKRGERDRQWNTSAAAATDADVLVFIEGSGLEGSVCAAEVSPYDPNRGQLVLYAGDSESAAVPSMLSLCRGPMGVSRELFDRLGGFDERIGHQMQLTDFCWRAILSGCSVTHAPVGALSVAVPTRMSQAFAQQFAVQRALAGLARKFKVIGLDRVLRSEDIQRLTSAGASRPDEPPRPLIRAFAMLGCGLGSAVGRISQRLRRGALSTARVISSAGLAPTNPAIEALDRTPVLIVHWRAPEWCALSVASLSASSQPVAITVLNNSPECFEELSEKLSSSAKVLDIGGNLGYSGAANLGLTQWLAGDEPYVIVAAHDCHVTPETVDLLVRAADRNQQYGVLGPVLTDKATGGSNTVPVGVDGSLHEILDADWLSGTCLLLTRRCIQEIGLFDASLGSYSEDVELCWRAKANGWKIGFVPSAHAHGLGSISPKAAALIKLNGVRLIRSESGFAAGVRAYSRAVVSVIRNLVGVIVHFRSPDARLASRNALRSGLPVLRHIGQILTSRSSASAPLDLVGTYSPVRTCDSQAACIKLVT